jgi:predicted nucleic acid-binding protein
MRLCRVALTCSPGEGDLFDGLDVYEHTESLGPFDAVLAATAVRRGWPLASADHAFQNVGRLKWLDPSATDFIKDATASG